jgi:hemerythrin-like metal-binding protein
MTASAPDMIVWSASMEIGVRSIDAEHRHLIEFINLVRTANDRQRSALSRDTRLLTDLKALLQAHFEREEDLMFGIDYPGVNGHLTAHSELQSDFDAKIAEAGMSGDSGCAVAFIADWMIGHMADEDTKLAQFIKAKKDEKAKAVAAAKAAKAGGPLKRPPPPKR